MPKLNIAGFDGVLPRTSPTMLGDSQAQVADNVKLYAGELRYWRGSSFVHTSPTANTQTIYRVKNVSANQERWLTWNSDVDVVPGPLTDSTEIYRLYLTDGVGPRKTSWALLSSGGGPYPTATMPMGVPAPTAAPLLTTAAGTSVAETRTYVYTYVTDFAGVTEESAPSPPATITIGANTRVDIAPTVDTPAGYGITKLRFYRSVSTTQGGAYLFVAETALIGYNDNLSVTALGETLKTVGWAPPPATLKGLVAFGGALAGFVGNTVYFSEPYQPHAWPLKYALTVPDKIIGLGVSGQSVVVMTDKFPHIISGPYPGALSQEKIPILEPCVSKSSIAADESGVIYASPNGLVGIGPGMRGVITRELFTRDEWAAQNPSTMKGVFYESKYWALRPTEPALVFSRTDKPTLSRHTLAVTCAFVEATTGNLYYLKGSDNKIYQADADDLAPLKYDWLSKRFVMPQATSFSCIKVDADYEKMAADAGYNATVTAIQTANITLFASDIKGALGKTAMNTLMLNGSLLQPIPELRSVRSTQVILYADGKEAASFSPTSFDVARLPAFKSQTIEMRITGTLSVRSVTLATSRDEIRA